MYSRRNLEKFLQHVQTPLSQKHVHVSQTLPKSGRKHFYPNFPVATDNLS